MVSGDRSWTSLLKEVPKRIAVMERNLKMKNLQDMYLLVIAQQTGRWQIRSDYC